LIATLTSVTYVVTGCNLHDAIRRHQGDGNSGVFFHVEFKPGTPDVVQGPQFEIDCTIGKHTAGVYDVGRRWIVWPALENETVVRQDEWNEYLLKVEGNRYIAHLNEVQMIDYTDPKPKGAGSPKRTRTSACIPGTGPVPREFLRGELVVRRAVIARSLSRGERTAPPNQPTTEPAALKFARARITSFRVADDPAQAPVDA
jgi:Domain of Unknown Function (DUF1080)